MGKFKDKSIFYVRKHAQQYTSLLRRAWYSWLGMKIGAGTFINKVYTIWPNQVSIGERCKLERNIYFKFSGIWNAGHAINIGNRIFIGEGCEFNISKGISIGDDSLIASGCKFIDHDHGIGSVHELIRLQKSIEKPIKIADNVWLGCNVVVLKGVEIGSGSIVAAGAVVAKSIPPNEIWGGVPAKKIGSREIEVIQ